MSLETIVNKDQGFFGKLRKGVRNGLITVSTIAALTAGLALAPVNKADAKNLTLACDPNNDLNLAGYKVYYGPTSRNYTGTGLLEGKSGFRIPVGDLSNPSSPSFTLSGIADSADIFVAVTAYEILQDLTERESGLSNEVYDPPKNTPAPLIAKPNITGDLNNNYFNLTVPFTGKPNGGSITLAGVNQAFLLDCSIATNLCKVMDPVDLFGYTKRFRDLTGTIKVKNTTGSDTYNFSLAYDAADGRGVTLQTPLTLDNMDSISSWVNSYPSVISIANTTPAGAMDVLYSYDADQSNRFISRPVPTANKDLSSKKYASMWVWSENKARVGVNLLNNGAYSSKKWCDVTPGIQQCLFDISALTRNNVTKLYIVFEGKEGYDYNLQIDDVAFASAAVTIPSLMTWQQLDNMDSYIGWVNDYPSILTPSTIDTNYYVEGTGSMQVTMRHNASNPNMYHYKDNGLAQKDWRNFSLLRMWIANTASATLGFRTRNVGGTYSSINWFEVDGGAGYENIPISNLTRNNVDRYSIRFFGDEPYDYTTWFDDMRLIDTKGYDAGGKIFFSGNSNEAIILKPAP
jgi:hypothetical protein